MLTSVAGFVAALALFALLIDREIRRVAAPSEGRVRRPRVGPVAIPLWAELALWGAAVTLLLPRVIGLLT